MQNRVTHFKAAPLLALVLGIVILCPPNRATAQNRDMSFDLFSGIQFNFRDINFLRQYDVYLCLTPGFKWHFGDHWQVAGMMYVDVVNTYDNAYGYLGNGLYRYYNYAGHSIVQFGMLDVSKEFKLGGLYCKASAGFFSESRYGVDLKLFFPVARWFAFEAQAGLTGLFSTGGNSWGFSPMGRFAGTIGGDIYLSGSNTQLRGVIGKYLYTDWGFEVEAMRHFRHSSVSLYANWNNLSTQTKPNGSIVREPFDGGFRVVVMLPPYHRKGRMVNIRPASNYYLPYSIMSHEWTNRMYKTDPEENLRDGWFSRDLLDWGSHTMEPDFVVTPNE
ncbi:MAG: YjbH domain-containing protein [Bacteroidales bacterium]|nr:YjbH domain-containing protein [Bacteroidales bacterium]